MPKHFPDRVDPWRLVDREQVVQGKIPLASMGRLLPLLDVSGETGEVVFCLSFGRDRDRLAVIRCEITATLDLTCQCCLEPVSMPLEIDSRLALVRGFEEAEGLPKELEPLMLADDGLLQVRELIEDELLLAVPDVPRHNDRDCVLKAEDQETVLVTEDAQAEANPFDILAVLKNGD